MSPTQATKAKAEVDLTDVTTAYSVPQDQDNAILVLAAAEDLGVDQSLIRTSEGGFTGPKAVIYEAFPEVKKADEERAKAEKGRE